MEISNELITVANKWGIEPIAFDDGRPGIAYAFWDQDTGQPKVFMILIQPEDIDLMIGRLELVKNVMKTM